MKKAIFITSFFILIAGFAMFSAPKAEASFWDHFSIGIGFGTSYASYGGYGGGYDSYYDDYGYGYDDYGYGDGYDYYPTAGYYGGGYNNNYNSYGNNGYYPSYQSYPTYNYPSYQSYGNYSPIMPSTPIAPTYGYYNGGCNNNYGCNTYQNSLSWTH
jgi:hypothetical protein